uniref:Si:dkey-78k11.9 n=1 Tax=Paramormyrops kingsleyae TaxID=1676925 RepID=A0A3B3SLP7_9TELE
RRPTNGTCKIDKSFTKVYLPTIYGLGFVVGLLANAWGLKCLSKTWKKIGNIQIFILNLGISDMLYIFTLPFLAYAEMKKSWIFGQAFCKITRFCFNLNLYSSIGFLTCISVYRYLGIVHTMRVKGQITQKHSVALSVFVWCMVCLQIIPDLYFEKTPKHILRFCFDTTVNEHVKEYLSYSIWWTVTGFGIPLLVFLGCYGHVAVVLSRRNDIDVTLKEQCLRLVVTITLLHAVCYIPFHVFRNLNLQTRVLQNERLCYKSFGKIYIAYQVCRGLAYLNPAIIPLMYLNCYDDVHVHFRKIRKRARESLDQLTRIVIINNPDRQPA